MPKTSRPAKRGRARAPRSLEAVQTMPTHLPMGANNKERAESGLQPAPSTMSENGGRRSAGPPARRRRAFRGTHAETRYREGE